MKKQLLAIVVAAASSGCANIPTEPPYDPIRAAMAFCNNIYTPWAAQLRADERKEAEKKAQSCVEETARQNQVMQAQAEAREAQAQDMRRGIILNQFLQQRGMFTPAPMPLMPFQRY